MKVDHIDLWVSFLGSKVIAHSYFSIRRANGEWPGWEQAFYMGNWGFWKNPELTSAYLSQRNFEINKRSTVIHCVLDSLPTCDKGLWLAIACYLCPLGDWRCLYDGQPSTPGMPFLSALPFAAQSVHFLLIAISTFLLPGSISWNRYTSQRFPPIC